MNLKWNKPIHIFHLKFNMFRIVFKYILYKLFTHHRKGHGIHSPFIYSFIRQVLVGDSDSEIPAKLIIWAKSVRKTTLPSTTVNYGAGSKWEKQKSVRVNRISVNLKFGKMLYRLVKFVKPDIIMELGTGSGLSTGFLGYASEGTSFLTVDGNNTRIDIARNNIEKLGLKNCTFVHSRFDQFLEKLEIIDRPVLVFLDGDHQFSTTVQYFNFFTERLDDDSVIVVDDIKWSVEMEKAWATIKDHPRCTISIDLFFTGIVFFRNGISKQHLIVNF